MPFASDVRSEARASDELSLILESLAYHSCEVELFDITRPEIGLPTCRAMFKDRKRQPIFPAGYALSPV